MNSRTRSIICSIPLSGRVAPRFSTELQPTVRDVGGRVFVGGVGDDVADAGVLEERVGRSLHHAGGRLGGGVELRGDKDL